MDEIKNHIVFSNLKKRFSEIKKINYNGITLLHIPKNREQNFHIVCTLGMSDFQMPVPNPKKHDSFIEIFFCLPDYWKPNEEKNKNHSWVWERIAFLAKYPKQRNTWFGNGHTIPFNKEHTQISEQYKQTYFLFSLPFFFKKMKPIKTENKQITFLAIIPIFKDELDYKLKSGINKLIKKFIKQGTTEKIDMFRLCSVRKKRFLF